MVRHRALPGVAALALVIAAGACRPDTVTFGYRPEDGARHRYRVTVEASAVTRIGDRAPRRTSSSFVLGATHEVVDSDDGGVTVEVTLRARGEEPQRLRVRLDRAGQLSRVEAVEGVPAARLGQVGIAEIFPASAGAPPRRPLAPGDRWDIDEALALPGARSARLTGTGRLATLGIVHGRKVATVESSLRLPVRGLPEGTATSGGAVLDGTQTTASRTTYALDDGVVESSTATTRSRLRVLLSPPAGTEAPALTGTVEVVVRSRTVRER
jgi:hypothetical protein